MVNAMTFMQTPGTANKLLYHATLKSRKVFVGLSKSSWEFNTSHMSTDTTVFSRHSIEWAMTDALLCTSRSTPNTEIFGFFLRAAQTATGMSA
jgi:hypothetical protein